MAFTRIAFAVLLFGIAGGACTTVRPVHPVEFFQKNSPDVVWVTYANNAVVPVMQPVIDGDTLKGMHQGSERTVTIPLNQIRSVKAKTPDRLKTALFVTAATGVFISGVYAMWISKAGPNTAGVTCGVTVRGFPEPYC